MDKQRLIQTAQALVADKKGILAADESGGTIKRRFDSINVESTEENRRNYREMLFRTAGVADFVSGVILFDETIRQESADGTPLVKVLSDQGIIPGIKVDKGTVPLPSATEELVTEGLDGLRDRLKEYFELGAGFTKWRAVISITGDTPTPYCLSTNAHALARFAAMSQEAGLVPIVEPEILRDGGHSIERCFEVTEETLREVFDQLAQQNVLLEGMLLKPSMVISGGSASHRADPEEVAERTIDCFKRVLPASVPGVVFLSGGEPDGFPRLMRPGNSASPSAEAFRARLWRLGQERPRTRRPPPWHFTPGPGSPARPGRALTSPKIKGCPRLKPVVSKQTKGPPR